MAILGTGILGTGVLGGTRDLEVTPESTSDVVVLVPGGGSFRLAGADAQYLIPGAGSVENDLETDLTSVGRLVPGVGAVFENELPAQYLIPGAGPIQYNADPAVLVSATYNGELAIISYNQVYMHSVPLPSGDSTVSQGDKQQLLWGYPDINWGGAAGVTEVPPPLHGLDNQYATIIAHRLGGHLQ